MHSVSSLYTTNSYKNKKETIFNIEPLRLSKDLQHSLKKKKTNSLL